MGWKNRLVERGKQLALTPSVLKVLSDDRMMRTTKGVIDARTRMRAAAQKAGEAWQLLVQGHGLPAVDPSIVDDVDAAERRVRIEPGDKGGTNGHAAPEKVNGAKQANGRAAETNGAANDELTASMTSRTSLSAI